ncbi:hypothetical protein Kpho02_04580 [Kitasatospora phosalacinea]|uniref:Bacterial Ig-like domain-containing protein n=1 Tax=Kitasatospora phosalacinea TaxID=2065 RepID=A0A9W6Q1C8_9ACTN|nr:Ig-like domain repeat protein [Kitasatospora phosalacinea]GLW68159.1 hypothetical protein Kpho02_04580 [Kitasatospora phosalacinea]
MVTATATTSGAGIGGGQAGAGGTVVLEGGTVTAANKAAYDSSAVGQGAVAGSAFGSLDVRAPAVLIVPGGAALRVPAGVTVTGDGSLRSGGTGNGLVVNNGAIQLPTDGVQWQQLGVKPHNFLVTFDANGGTPTEAVRVFATSFAAGARTVPAPPTRAGFTFTGWNTAADGSGRPVEIGPDTPLDADRTVHAQWAADTVTALVPRGTPEEGVDLPVDLRVTARDAAAGTPPGTVTLYVDGTAVGTATLDADGRAVLTYPHPTAGTHVLHAVYAPSGSEWRASRSPDVPVEVTTPSPSPSPSPSPTPKPSPSPSPEPTPSPTPHPGPTDRPRPHHHGGGLPPTGAGGIGTVAAGTALSVLLGVGVLLFARNRRRREGR